MASIYDTLVKSQGNISNFYKLNNIDSAGNKPLPTFTSRLNDYQNQIVDMELEDNILIEIDKNIKSTKNLDIYKLVALTSGSEFKGSLNGLLASLQDLLLKKEKLLYSDS